MTTFPKLNTVACSGCNYCMPCPYGIEISHLFAFRNDVLLSHVPLSDKKILDLYCKALPNAQRRAEHCTGCGRCLGCCPQDINIPEEIAVIDSWIDSLIDRELSK